MKKLNSAEIKETLFTILSVFADFCDENGLRYYLCGGTMLGAIRHKDFIPWDDDIDVLVPRPDYEKLHMLLKDKLLLGRYQLLSLEHGNSGYPYAKLADMRTETFSPLNRFDKHLYIDLFPMDGLPADTMAADRYLDEAGKWKHIYGYAASRYSDGKKLYRKILKAPAVFAAHRIGYLNVAKRLDAMAKAYPFENSEYIAGIAWSNGAKERMCKAEYEPMVDVEFHGRLFHAPACWDFYLRAMFGDYMQLPAEKDRRYHMLDAYLEERV